MRRRISIEFRDIREYCSSKPGLVSPVTKYQLFHVHSQGQLLSQEIRPRHHLDHHGLQHFQVVPIPQMGLELTEPCQDVSTARHAELVENFHKVPQTLACNARPVDDLRAGMAMRLRNAIFETAPHRLQAVDEIPAKIGVRCLRPVARLLDGVIVRFIVL